MQAGSSGLMSKSQQIINVSFFLKSVSANAFSVPGSNSFRPIAMGFPTNGPHNLKGREAPQALFQQPHSSIS